MKTLEFTVHIACFHVFYLIFFKHLGYVWVIGKNMVRGLVAFMLAIAMKLQRTRELYVLSRHYASVLTGRESSDLILVV